MPTLHLAARRPVLAAVAVALVVLSATSVTTARSDSLKSPQPWSVTQAPLELGVDRYLVQFLHQLRDDYSTQLQFPFRYAKQRPGRFLLGTAGIMALVLTDHWTYEILAPRASFEDNNLIEPAQQFSRLGNGRSSFPLVIGLGAVGLLADSPRERETSLMLVEAVLTSATWTQLIKTLSGRERPREKEETVSDWEGPSFLAGDDDRDQSLRSFPSGHSTGAWAAATILANQYPKYRVVPVLAYGTATVMSYSRMVVGAHWLSDVVVGGLIGYGSAKQVLSAYRAGRPRADTSKFGLSVDVAGDYRGIKFRYDF